MSSPEFRSFELTTTVHFPTIAPHAIVDFATKLDAAVGSVAREFPAVIAYLVTPGSDTGDVSYGLRFEGADPRYMVDMADEILERAVDAVASQEGTPPAKAEREESTLVHA